MVGWAGTAPAYPPTLTTPSEHQPLLRTSPVAHRPFLVWAAAAVAVVVLGPTLALPQGRLHLAPLTPTERTTALVSVVVLPSWWELCTRVRRGSWST